MPLGSTHGCTSPTTFLLSFQGRAEIPHPRPGLWLPRPLSPTLGSCSPCLPGFLESVSLALHGTNPANQPTPTSPSSWAGSWLSHGSDSSWLCMEAAPMSVHSLGRHRETRSGLGSVSLPVPPQAMSGGYGVDGSQACALRKRHSHPLHTHTPRASGLH